MAVSIGLDGVDPKMTKLSSEPLGVKLPSFPSFTYYIHSLPSIEVESFWVREFRVAIVGYQKRQLWLARDNPESYIQDFGNENKYLEG